MVNFPGCGSCTLEAIPIGGLAPWISSIIWSAAVGVTPERTIGGLAPWISSIIPGLLGLTKLEKNWDSYGSDPPTVELVREVVWVLHYSEIMEIPEPRAVPMPGGGIQLEWVLRGVELEVSFHPDGSASGLITDNEGHILDDGEKEFGMRDLPAVREVLGNFAARLRGMI